MDIQNVPKVGISSVVHSKHIDADSIDVIDNDIALFDSESVISLYSGPSKLEVLIIGLCLEGEGTFNINLQDFQLSSGGMVIALPSQIIEHRQFSPDFKGIFFAVSKSLLETLPKVGNLLALFFYLKDYPCFSLTPNEQRTVQEYHTFIRKRLRSKGDLYRREVVLGLMQGFFFELCNIFNNHAPAVTASVKSKSWKFSSIRARCVDFGITAIPRCRSHRSATWATVFPWASAIEASVGFVKKPSADCASGLHAVIGIETESQNV